MPLTSSSMAFRKHGPHLPVALAAALALAIVAQADTATLDPNFHCTARRGDEVTYHIKYSVVVTPPAGTKKLQVWIPVPTSDDTQQVNGYKVSTYPDSVTPRFAEDKTFGNRFAYFEFVNPLGAQVIRQEYTAKVANLRWGVDPASVQKVTTWPASFHKYLRSDNLSVSVDPTILKLAHQIVPQRHGEVADMAQVMKWIIANVRYDHTQCSLHASSDWLARYRCGHCSDFHGFAAAVGRALGYATRVCYGIHLYPATSPSHCKLEVFLPHYGWVSYDISTTQAMIKDIAADKSLSALQRQALTSLAYRRLFAGFRDNQWLRVTRGTDYVLPFGGPKVPLVRTAFIEADGEPLPDPDPDDKFNRQFAWMTVFGVTASKTTPNPFKDLACLAPGAH